MSTIYGTLTAAIEEATTSKRTVYCSVDAIEYVIRSTGEWHRVRASDGVISPDDLTRSAAMVANAAGYWLDRVLSRDCTNTFHCLCHETTCGCRCHDPRVHRPRAKVDKSASHAFPDVGVIDV